MGWLRRIFFLALIGVAIVASVQLKDANSSPVSVSYVLGEFVDVELWLVVLATFVTGAVFAALLTTYQLARQGLVTRRYRKTARRLEAEVHELRNLPLAPEEPAPRDPAAEEPTGEQPGGALERGA